MRRSLEAESRMANCANFHNEINVGDTRSADTTQKSDESRGMIDGWFMNAMTRTPRDLTYITVPAKYLFLINVPLMPSEECNLLARENERLYVILVSRPSFSPT